MDHQQTRVSGSKGSRIHPFGQIYWPFPVHNGSSIESSNNKKLSSMTEERREIESRVSNHNSYWGKSFFILCERCGERPARISCSMCCSKQLCIKCCYFLHSSKKSNHHRPIFFLDASKWSKAKEETSINNSTLKDICEDALSSIKTMVNLKKTTDSKINELQEIREEKKIQETMRKKKEKEFREKEAIRNTSVSERNNATIINRSVKLFLEKIRNQRRTNSLKYFIESLLRETSNMDYFAVIIQKNFRRFSIRNYFLITVPNIKYQDEMKRCVFARVNKDFNNRRKQERTNLLHYYQRNFVYIQQGVEFQLFKLQEFRFRCKKCFQVISMELEEKAKKIQINKDNVLNCNGDLVSEKSNKSMKYKLVRLHHLKKKLRKYKRQIEVIDIQLTCIRSIKEKMTALIGKNDVQLRELSMRWVTINLLLNFVNSKLNLINHEPPTDNYFKWLTEQKQKMLQCVCEYDAAQESFLHRQIEATNFILNHSIQSYEFAVSIIDSLKLEIGWESEQTGLELKALSNEENIGDIHSHVDRIKHLRHKAKIVRSRSSETYIKMDTSQEILNNFNFQDKNLYNGSSESTVGYDYCKSVPTVSKDNWMRFFESKPWINI